MNSKDSIEAPKDIKIWYITESRKEPTSEAYNEWKRRGQELCFEVAYTQGYQDASEAMYQKLQSQILDYRKALEEIAGRGDGRQDRKMFAVSVEMKNIAQSVLGKYPSIK